MRHLVRFWVNLLVLSFVGVSVGLATIAFNRLAVSLVGSIFCIWFLCFMQYDAMFQLGAKDHYRPAEVVRPKRTFGLKIALCGYTPLFVVVLVTMLFRLIGNDDAAVICKLIYYALHGTYVQTHALILEISDSIGSWDWIFFLLYMLPGILASALGYLLGTKDKPLRTYFGMSVKVNAKKMQ